MKELEKQYNKNVKNPANFSIHRPSYMAGGRAALEWVLLKIQSQQNLAHYRQDLLWGLEKDIKKELDNE